MSRLEIVEVDFVSNYVGMDLVSSFDFPQYNNLHSLNFSCPYPLYEIYTDPNGGFPSLIPLYYGLEESYLAIRARGYTNLTIGSNNLDLKRTTIQNHNRGIYVFECNNPSILNCDLYNIRNHSDVSAITSEAIGAETCGGRVLVKGVHVERSDYGVSCLNSSLSLLNSTIYLSNNYSVFVNNPPNPISMVNNEISSLTSAVYLNNVRKGYIKNNSIIGQRNGLVVDMSSNLQVLNNPIISGNRTALSFNDVQYSQVKENPEISGGVSGFLLSDVQFTEIKDNHFVSSGTGLRSSASEHNNFCCNVFDGNNSGMEFNPSCMHTTISGTTFSGNNERGLTIHEDALIGPQILQGNSWSSEMATFDGRYIGTDPVKVEENSFVVSLQNIPSAGMDLDIAPTLTSDWFSFLNVTEPTCGVLCDVDDAFGYYQTGNGVSNADLLIATEEIENLPESKKAISWTKKQYLYKVLQNNPSFMEEEELHSFYQSAATTALGQLYNIDFSIYHLDEIPQEYEAQYNSLATNLEEANNELEANLDALHAATGDNEAYDLIKADRMALLSAYEAILSDYVELISIIAMERLVVIEALLDENQSIETEFIWDSNERFLNYFFLNYIAKGNSDYSETDKLQVESIANQCFEEGGRSVFRAGAIARLWDEKIETVGCTSERSILNEEAVTREIVSIFPNPAQNIVSITENETSFAIKKVRILNALGQVVREFDFYEKNMNLDVSAFKSGLYEVQFLNKVSVVQSKKLTILR